MGRESELRFAIAARRLGLITRNQLVDCSIAWLEDLNVGLTRVSGKPERRPETILYEMGVLSEAGLASVLKEMKKGDVAIDSQSRHAILKLNPPPAVRDWVMKLPEQRREQTMVRKSTSRDERYELGEEIARGGVGRVVEGKDRKLRREVAIKLLMEGAEPEIVERFLREAQITARLDHPNVVPVYDVGEIGTAGGRQMFLAMKKVAGKDLGAALRLLAAGDEEAERLYTRPRLLQIFQNVCLGIAYAHARGVLHRDLKPANVMLGDYGEVLIVDWGLAKVKGEVDPAALLTQEGAKGTVGPLAGITMVGQVLGTPSYMSPEAAEGRPDDMDERSDIYALGTILYTILTWRAPFDGRTKDEVLQKVREGRLVPPAKRVHEARHRVPDPVPPGLEAICLKALALRPAERYASAMDLFYDLQSWLDGASERARIEREARERVEKGREHLARYHDLAIGVQEAEAQVRLLAEKIRPHQPVEDKAPLWEAEGKLRAAGEARIEAQAQAEAEFRSALRIDPACGEASDGISDLIVERYLEAERRGDRGQMLLLWNSLAPYDRHGERRYWLDAPGKLALKTVVYKCGCLRPVAEPGWGVEFVKAASVAWREGRPRPDVAVERRDLPVPAMWMRKPGTSFGHRPDCARHEATGAEIFLSRYKEEGRRLVPGPEKKLGKTPLAPTELPQGSYRVVIRAPRFPDIVLPVYITRDCLWDQEVVLYAAEDIPKGFSFVPAGPFLYGADGVTRETRDLFVARHPVTCAEYLEYLNDLCRHGQAEEAARRSPKEGERRLWPQDGEGPTARFRLPRPEEDPALAWEPAWPAVGVSWHDALAYCEWRSAKDGRACRLLHEEEYEKAARGVDGRAYAFGHDYDGTFAHTNVSLAGAALPRAAGGFPADESVYGIRDLTGGASTWCLNLSDPEVVMARAARGGSWGAPPTQAHAAFRQSLNPDLASRLTGFRLAVSAEAWP
jgi:serine/threonine-protein kinase